MLLSDVIKKFGKAEPMQVKEEAPQLEEESPSVPAKLRRGRAAALEFLPLLKAKLIASNGDLHAGTMLSAAAWLTGTSLYRSFHFDEEDRLGTVLKADEINREWERLVYLLEQYNFQKADIPVGRLVLAAMGAPEFFRSQVDMLVVQSELQEQYNAVMQKHGFDYLSGARVGVILCSTLIQQYSGARIIDAEAAAGVVAQGIFEAASAVPPPLRSAR
jgi:hypothetical protein